MSTQISKDFAKSIWIHAQKLDRFEPFGAGPSAARAAVEHLGYVQIDTINVIERCHHHILFSRIPKYKRKDLFHLQTLEKSVFEFWTHAMSYVPTRDYRYFIQDMKNIGGSPGKWLAKVKPEELQKVLRMIKKDGALSIRDFNDDVLVEKDHEWASRKPSKKALQLGFFSGRLVVSERQGMLKKYELTEKHFGWKSRPKAASEKEILEYLLERSIRSQGIVSLDSICYLEPKRKPAMKKLIEKAAAKGEIVLVEIQGLEKVSHWTRPQNLESKFLVDDSVTHILSPFDPLIIQRKRLNMFFDYEHHFEAYFPKEKRKYGYFTLPILIGDQIVGNLDLKTDREARRLILQKWNWLPRQKSPERKKRIEEELHRFEGFQLGD